MYPRKTHFEQIPLARVKEIAQPLLDTDPRENDGITVPRADNSATSAPDDWREIAQQVQRESDPTKMIELVQQLIARFDRHEQLRSLPCAGKNRPDTEQSHNASGD